VRKLGGLGISPEDILICLVEPHMENWGVRGAQLASEVDLGYRVDI
jgi:hypothetical protein